MSIKHLLNTGACPPEWVSLRVHRLHSCTDLQFDRDLIGEIRLNGNIPPGPHRTFLHTDGVGLIAWKSFSQEDIPAGANGDYLQTIAGLVQWAPPSFGPSSILPGAANQVFVTDPTGTTAQWSDDIDLPGKLVLNDELVTNASTGLPGEVLLSRGGGLSPDWGNVPTTAITPGAPLSILQTNLFGTGTQWSTLLNLPSSVQINSGNLTLLAGDITANSGSLSTGFITTTTGTSNLSNVSLNGDLAFNAVSGSVGQVLKKTAANDQAWSNLLVSDLAPGINRQVLQMNGATPTWVSSLTLPAAATISCSGGVQFTGAGTFFDCTAYARFLGNPLCARFDGQVALNDTTSSFGDFTSNADFYNNGGLSLDGSFGNPYEVPSASGVSGTSPVWRPQNEYILCYNPNAYDVNTSAKFMLNGIAGAQAGTTFTFDNTTGLFTCQATGYYTFEIQCELDTMDAQSKFTINDGTNKYGFASVIYIPGTVQKQFYSFSTTLLATVGEVWSFIFEGVGVCNTIPTDPTYGNPQSFLKITRFA